MLFGTCILLSTFLNIVLSADELCHDTLIKINEQTFNLNHLKDHLPPNQNYKDKANIYAESSDKKQYAFFNLGDIVRSQSSSVSNRPKIKDRCKPTSNGPRSTTNRPAACMQEPDTKNCDSGEKVCWIALGSCDSMKASVMGDNMGINILYENGADEVGFLYCILLTEF